MAVFVVVGRFFVRSIAAQSPEHEPEQGAAGIDVPRPPRCVIGTEDEERDNVINEEESSHSAFFLSILTVFDFANAAGMEFLCCVIENYIEKLIDKQILEEGEHISRHCPKTSNNHSYALPISNGQRLSHANAFLAPKEAPIPPPSPPIIPPIAVPIPG